MNYIRFSAIAMLSFVTTTSVAHAADEDALLDLAKPVFDAVVSGQWVYAAALSLVLAVAVARKYGGKIHPFLDTGTGAMLLAVLGSFGASLAAGLAGGVAVTWSILWGSLKVAAIASGGYGMFQRLIMPLVNRISKRYPKIGWFLKPLSWVFRDRASEANVAGDAALAANPSKGLSGVVGEVKEIE